MTVLNPALHDTLRTLKLTGMLETLDARLAQARTGQLGHLDFLQVLCDDEIARRETAALARRLRVARFEEQATIETFDFTANPKIPAPALRDLAALRWLDAGESVILYGPTGVGKTHVAQGLGHNVIRRGGQVRFVKTSRVLADLAGGHADRTWERRLREYTHMMVLLLGWVTSGSSWCECTAQNRVVSPWLYGAALAPGASPKRSSLSELALAWSAACRACSLTVGAFAACCLSLGASASAVLR